MSLRPALALGAALVLLSDAALADAPPAETPPAPAAPAQTKEPPPWLPPIVSSDVPRLQERLYAKERHLYLDVAGQYLYRNDFYNDPAIGVTLAYYLTERWDIEVGFTYFFATLQAPAEEILKQYGLVPDAHQPFWMLRAGLRWTIGYGKVLIGRFTIHLEPQLAFRGAVLRGDGVYDPGIDITPALLIHWTQHFHTVLEVSILPHLEQRTTLTPVLGVMPSLSIGAGVEL